MKARILNNNVYSDEKFKVISMNYDFVMVQINDDKKVVRREEVELISENPCEDIFSQYKDILKIKLDNGITPKFYSAFISYIENIIGNKVEQVDVLEDDYRFIKKGIWEKELLIVINKLRIFKISTIGEKYGENFRFTIKEKDLNEFSEECKDRVKILENEIGEKLTLKRKYEESLDEIVKNRIMVKKPICLNI